MLATDKISHAFTAIIAEAEKLVAGGSAEELSAGLKTIISIAKHQSDIRGVKTGTCTSDNGCSK